MSASRWGLLASLLCSLAGARAADDLKINTGGRVIIRSEVKLNTGEVIVADGGTLDLVGGKVTTSAVKIELNGLLMGSGMIAGNLTSDGTVALDSPIGVLTVTGNVLLNSGSTLKLALGGLTAGNFSFIDANGTVTVGGTLVLNFFNGFDTTITNADSLTLINSPGTILGTFGNVMSGGRLVTEDGLGQLTVTYNTSVLVVNSFTRPPLVSTLLYATGDPVSGEPMTTKFATFGVPSINSISDSSFTARLNTATEPQSAVLVGAPVTVAFRQGDKALGPVGPDFASFGDPMLNGAGHLAFRAKLTGDGINGANNSGIWTNAGGMLTTVVRAGDAATGLGGAKIKSVLSAGQSDTGAIPFIASLAGPGVAPTTARSLWIWETTGTTLLLRVGTAATFTGDPARIVTNFATLASVPGSPGHGRSVLGNTVLARVGFSKGLSGIAEISPTAKKLIAKSGAPVPNAPAGATFASFGLPAFNANGDAAFFARLTTGPGGVIGANNHAIFADTSMADTELVARTGDVAPGVAPLLFVAFTDPVYNAARDVAFIARLNAGGTGIWWKEAGTLKLLARRDQQPPGTAAGTKWDTFVSLALPDGVGPAFIARMRPGPGKVTGRNNVGLWALDRFGILHLVARTGDSVSIHGTLPAKIIASLTCLPAVLHTPDHARSYNDARQLTYKATFTDRTQAIFRADIP